MGKVVAVVQSNYIPWKGYFDLIRRADEFVLYDEVQYTRRDWRNRNRIKTPQGVRWLSIPVDVKGKYRQPIRAARIHDPGWAKNHWRTLTHCYGRAPHFRAYRPILEPLYLGNRSPFLSEINATLIRTVAALLGIHTRITCSTDYRRTAADPTGRLLEICLQAGATEYLTGPAARAYLDEPAFAAAGITVRWMDYGGYPEYPQLHPPFEHAVTALDLLFMTGPAAAGYLERVRHAA
jgi:hypothetical protein